MGIILIVILIGAAYYLYTRYGKNSDSALDAAKERYARGEISREEFEKLKDDLS